MGEDKSLYGRLETLRQCIRSPLTYTAVKFPEYTPHDIGHCEAVEDIINIILSQNKKCSLTKYEKFLLLSAVLLHDIGMIGTTEEEAGQVRAAHHTRSAAWIRQNYKELSLEYHEARIVAQIAQGHREEDLSSSEYDDVFLGTGNNVRVRFLASLLRLADECDVTYQRASSLLCDTIKPTGKSANEFQKHMNIKGIGLGDGNNTIIISALAHNQKEHDMLMEVKDKIQVELDKIIKFLKTGNVFINNVQIDIEEINFIASDISFSIDQNKILELLIGDHLYSKKDVALRELIQNSIDACRAKCAIETKYTPSIKVIRESEDMIVIIDNGVGMSFDDVKEYLSTIGNSLYGGINQGVAEFSPISKFGIGILSAFLISDSITVETRKEEHSAYRFSIDTIAAKWNCQNCTFDGTGTKIILHLNEIGKKINIADSLKSYFLCPEVRVQYLSYPGRKLMELSTSWCTRDIDENFAKKYNRHQGRVDTTFHEVLQYTISGADVIWGYREGRNGGRIFVFNHGIFVGMEGLYGLSNAAEIYINIKDEVIDLQLSRDAVVLNDKWHAFLSVLVKKALDIIYDLYFYDKMQYTINIARIISHAGVYHLKSNTKNKFFNLSIIIFDSIFFPCMINGDFKYIRIKDIVHDYKINIYKIISMDIESEMKEMVKLIKDEVVVFMPYEFSDIAIDGGKYKNIFNVYLKKMKLEYKYVNLNDILIKNSIITRNKYKSIIPDNVSVANFRGPFKPIVVVSKKAIIYKNKKIGNAYLGNILLLQQLLDENNFFKFKDKIINFYGDNITAIRLKKKHHVYIDENDFFINEILKKINENLINKDCYKLIYRYFNYISYLPLVYCNMPSCVIFIEVIKNLENEIATALGITGCDIFYDRYYPNFGFYISCYGDPFSCYESE